MFSKFIWSQINFGEYEILIKKTNEKIKIDGIIDEETWKECDIGKDFFMITPVDNQKASQFSEARVTFDNDFFYVAIIFFNNSVKGKYVVESSKETFHLIKMIISS